MVWKIPRINLYAFDYLLREIWLKLPIRVKFSIKKNYEIDNSVAKLMLQVKKKKLGLNLGHSKNILDYLEEQIKPMKTEISRTKT